MRHTSLRRATAACTLVLVAAAIGVADAQRRQPAGPDFDAFYDLGPDSLVRRGVPKGAIEGPFTLTTDVYPGTVRDYWISLLSKLEF